MLKNPKFNKALSVLNVLLTALVFVFAYQYGKELLQNANFEGLSSRWWALMLSVVMFLAFYMLASLHWSMICRLIDKKASKLQPAAFFASQPYKYLPTSIFTFSFRAKFAKALGTPIKESSYAQLLENFNILTSGIIVSGVFLLLYWNVLAGLLVIGISFIAIYFLHRNKVEFKLPILSKKVIPIYQLLPALLLITAAWVIGGIGFYFTAVALNNDADVRLMIAANAAAYVASILAVFAPGGIGVRELVLANFSVSNAAIVLWRIVTFAVDMISGLAGIVFIRRTTKK